MSPWNQWRAANVDTNGVVMKDLHASNSSDKVANALPFDVSILCVPTLAGPNSIVYLRKRKNDIESGRLEHSHHR
jgi:hypothetical protein